MAETWVYKPRDRNRAIDPMRDNTYGAGIVSLNCFKTDKKYVFIITSTAHVRNIEL